MARPPHVLPALTPERRALVESLELYVEGVLGTLASAGSDPIVVTLPVRPDAAVAAELRRRYLEAGWPRVLVAEKAGSREPYIQLETLVDVYLGSPA